MTFDLTKILQSKRAFRQRLAARPIEEKLDLLDALRERALALRASGLRSRMLLQVHDELVFEVAGGERAALEELVRREMGAAYPLSVPLEVSVGGGRDWNSADH